ncbi:MAG: RNA methyltransferase, partial [Firmicutes bacterium]|nr:RNA methyltransferase [Bacillota bacterium]
VIIREGFKNAPSCGAPVYELPASLYERLCDTKTPQGITAVLKMRSGGRFSPKSDGAYVYCDGVADPGNVGTIIRTADAAGLDGVILSEGCVDIYAPKTVRASMGSFFNTDIITGKTADDLREYKNAGFSLIGGALGASSADYRTADYKKPVIIVVGNEANGISREVLDMCARVKIPIYGAAESLNVSVAAGILMYEWARNNLT